MKSEAGTYTFRKTETHMWAWFEGELVFKYKYDKTDCTMKYRSYGVKFPHNDTVSLQYRDIVRYPGKYLAERAVLVGGSGRTLSIDKF